MYKKVIAISLLVIAGGVFACWWWLKSFVPNYSGNEKVPGLKQKVEVYFDKFGIPHIYAQSEPDAYHALGYIVARDRLFQLEMIRRLASGRLAEVIGQPMVKSDKFFRTLGLANHADQSAAEFERSAPANIKAATNAYLAGINAFIAQGNEPFEFKVLGIEAEKLKLRDIFLVTGYMAFGFAEGFRIDPMLESLYRTVGDEYMNELELGWPKGAKTIPVTGGKSIMGTQFSDEVTAMLSAFPVAPWHGSNAWAIAPGKTKAKAPILCNDTHMGYSQPAIWYEAHIEYPGFSHYGNYIAGIPFALAGHNSYCGVGLTMLENDDTDFFIEKIENDKVFYKGNWTPVQKRNEQILVKERNAVSIEIAQTPHGPLMQDVFEKFPLYQVPVAVSWTYLKFPSKALEAIYGFNTAKSMDDARLSASLIHAPGLSIVYGDKDGHIAWWAAAKLVQRPAGQFSKRFLDGSVGTDDPLGYFTFDENPKSEDPASGFVYSANNQPDSCAVGFYPGYYVPEDRALSIEKRLREKSDWDVESSKQLVVLGKSDVYAETAHMLLDVLKQLNSDALSTEQANRLSSWEGEHGLESVGPVIYYRWVYNILHEALADQMGEANFKSFMNTHAMKTAYPSFLRSYENIWWENPFTREKEIRPVIVNRAWKKTIDDLNALLGKDVSAWRWSSLHTLEHEHPLGKQKPFDWLMNVGPEPVPGGNEVINNTGFEIDSSGRYKVTFGPSMRRIVDFSDLSKSYSVLPTGQSGYFMAPHYSDQFKLFNSNTFRPQLMVDKNQIKSQSKAPLILEP
jgi:penicillin amidase